MTITDLDPLTILYGNTDREHQRLDVGRPGTAARLRYQELFRQIQAGDLIMAIDALESGAANFARAPLLQRLSADLFDKIFVDTHADKLKIDGGELDRALDDPTSQAIRTQLQDDYAKRLMHGAGIGDHLRELQTGGIIESAYQQDEPGPLLKERHDKLADQDILSLDVFNSLERKALTQLIACGHDTWLYQQFRRRVAHALQAPLREIYADLLIERRYQNQVLIRRRNPRGKTILHLHHDADGNSSGKTYCGQILPQTLRIAPRGTWTEAEADSAQFRRCPKCEASGNGPVGLVDDPIEYPVLKIPQQDFDTMVTATIERLLEKDLLQQTDLSRMAYTLARPDLLKAVAEDLRLRGYYSAFWRASPSMRRWRRANGLSLAEADSKALNPEQLHDVASSLVDERSPEQLKRLLRDRR